MSEGKAITDLLGVKPYGDAFLEVVRGACSFLGLICRPAAEEFGLYWGDRVRSWRTRNVVGVAQIAARKLNESGGVEGRSAPPRLVAGILERGSWVDNPELQELWGGLLASSCTPDGLDDSNVVFQDLLSGFTGLQARILKYSCEGAKKFATDTGLIYVEDFEVEVRALSEITEVEDIQRLDREVDRLVVAGLLTNHSGFQPVSSEVGGAVVVRLTPSSLGLHLYVRCHGSIASPVEYFGVTDVRQFSQASGTWHPI